MIKCHLIGEGLIVESIVTIFVGDSTDYLSKHETRLRIFAELVYVT